MRWRIICFTLFGLAVATSSGATGETAPRSPLEQLKAFPFRGGNGNAMSSAVVLVDARTEETVAQLENQWVERYQQGWKMVERSRINDGCKTYDRITLVDTAGLSKTVFFYLGGCFWRLDPLPP